MSPLLMLLATAVHVAHTALGLPTLEGIEQFILSPGPNISYIRWPR